LIQIVCGIIATRCITYIIDRVLEKPRHWGPPGDVVSEYKTHSDTSTVTVYKDDEVIYSTETGVRAH